MSKIKSDKWQTPSEEGTFIPIPTLGWRVQRAQYVGPNDATIKADRVMIEIEPLAGWSVQDGQLEPMFWDSGEVTSAHMRPAVTDGYEFFFVLGPDKPELSAEQIADQVRHYFGFMDAA